MKQDGLRLDGLGFIPFRIAPRRVAAGFQRHVDVRLAQRVGDLFGALRRPGPVADLQDIAAFDEFCVRPAHDFLGRPTDEAEVLLARGPITIALLENRVLLPLQLVHHPGGDLQVLYKLDLGLGVGSQKRRRHHLTGHRVGLDHVQHHPGLGFIARLDQLHECHAGNRTDQGRDDNQDAIGPDDAKELEDTHGSALRILT